MILADTNIIILHGYQDLKEVVLFFFLICLYFRMILLNALVCKLSIAETKLNLFFYLQVWVSLSSMAGLWYSVQFYWLSCGAK